MLPTSFRIFRPLNSSKRSNVIYYRTYIRSTGVFIRGTAMAHACAREGERRREKERGRKPASAKYCINKCTGRNIHGRAKPSSPPPLLSTIFTALSTFPSLHGLLFYSVDHQAAPAEPDIHSASFLLFTYKRDTQPPSRKARIYS